MAAPGGRGRDLDTVWSEIVEPIEEDHPQVNVIYRRRTSENIDRNSKRNGSFKTYGASFAPTKKVCGNRSLSIRGRESIVVSAIVSHQPKHKGEPKARPPKAASLKKRGVPPSDFSKERAYFQEVDSVDLLEESPSPNKYVTWVDDTQNSTSMPDISSILRRWMKPQKLTFSCGPSTSLPGIIETPLVSMETLCNSVANLNILDQNGVSSKSVNNDRLHSNTKPQGFDTRGSHDVVSLSDGSNDLNELEKAIKKVSLGSSDQAAFSTLLMVCDQSVPSRLSEVFFQYCELNSIVKIGEGTYGEAFKAGGIVGKIVPIDGNLLVNGEIQKRSTELLEEVLLSRALNSLRGDGNYIYKENSCAIFIETKDLKVCKGMYDDSLIKAWEEWDEKHGSENDNPREFPEDQCYVVFILADGGRDLESFVLLNFDEARSLLIQVTIALAVAEAACEFEHRDLHWGNILLTRSTNTTTEFTLQGKKMKAKTFGLRVSIIDFTLSRVNTGDSILFLDLSTDPAIFEGPKGDKQAETYRRMKDITQDLWEGSFFKTNVLWLQYLVDILLLKKTFQRTVKNERDLRSLKKRMNDYESAQDVISDEFFYDQWM